MWAFFPSDDVISMEGHSCLFERADHGWQMLHLDLDTIPADW